MKKKLIIIILSTIIAYFAKAQNLTLAMHGGASFKHPIAGLSAGVNFKDFNIRTGFDRELSSKTDAATIFKSYIGHTFSIGESYYFNPGIGHAYVLKSVDIKGMNYNAVLYNAEFGYKWDFRGEAMATYISYSHAGEFNLLSIGLRGIFSQNNCN